MENSKTKQKITPRPRQRKAAQEIVKNLLSDKPKSTGQVLESVGFSKGSAEQPSRVLQSEGFKIALQETGLRQALEAQGINPAKIAQKIDVLLNAVDKEGNEDYNAIDKGIKHATSIYGIVPDDKPKTQTTYNFIFSKEVQEDVAEIEARIKAKLIQKHETNS